MDSLDMRITSIDQFINNVYKQMLERSQPEPVAEPVPQKPKKNTFFSKLRKKANSDPEAAPPSAHSAIEVQPEYKYWMIS